MTVKIEPLFGGTDWITDAQRATVDTAAEIIKPQFNTAWSEDEREDHVLVAIFNSETAWGQELAYRLEVTPTGVVRSFKWDSIADPEEWDWDDAEDTELWRKLTAAGLSYEVDDDATH